MRFALLLQLLCLPIAVNAAEIPEDLVIPEDKEIICFEQSKLGKVTFLHKKHSELKGVECITCHHTMKDVGKPKDCHDCHQRKPKDETPKSIKAFHTRCRGCHEYTVESGRKAGPVKKCTLCHIKLDRLD